MTDHPLTHARAALRQVAEDAPPRPYIDLLRSELAAYQTKRAQAAEKLADQPEYAAKVDAGWRHAIGVKLAQIQKAQTQET